MSAPHHASIPARTWAVPLVASGLLGLKFTHIVPADAGYVLVLAGVLLGAAVFAAVHHSEVLALKLGEPFGSILLAVAVTVIEIGLIVSIMLSAVVLLAKALSYPVDAVIATAGLPKAFVGVVIAVIVLMPEGLAAVKSALRNRLQNSINLALGSAIASIGLTIPTVALVSLALSRQIALGVSQTDMTLLILTLYISALTLGAGRTTMLQDAVHLVIFAAFMLVSAIP
jgi:Ca2+/H+ antiporter